MPEMSRLKRRVAWLLIAALVWTCPGLGAYEAVAAEIESVHAGAPLQPVPAVSQSLPVPGTGLSPLQDLPTVPSLAPASSAGSEAQASESEPAAPEASASESAARPENVAPEAAAPGPDGGQPPVIQVQGRWSSKARSIGRQILALRRAFRSPYSDNDRGLEPANLAPLPPAPEDQHLVYDLQSPSFRAGYVAAMAWRPGDALELPRGKAREPFIAGLAYRVAEAAKDEGKGKEFKKKALADPKAISSLLSLDLARAPQAPSLRGAADHDFAQGYLTAAAWRPGKQLWMPAPSLGERLNPLLRKRMAARDQKFVDGLIAGLREAHGDAAEQALRAELAGGPAVGTKELADKLPYSLAKVLEDSYDKSLEEKLPFIPGKVKMPRSAAGLMVMSLLVSLGINLHINSQAYLVYGLTKSKAMIGVVRNVHYASYSASNFLPVGPAISKTDYRTMITWTAAGRAMLMGLIPILYFAGYLPFYALIAIVVMNPYFQNTMNTAATAANASILGRDENVVREITAFTTKVSATMGLITPLLAAFAVSHLVLLFGEPAGYAAAYAIYAATVALSIPAIRWLVRDPRYYDPSIKDKPVTRWVNAFQPLVSVLMTPVAAFKWLRERRKAAAAAAKTDPQAAQPPPPAGPLPEGWLASRLEKAARALDKHEATQGVAVILRSKTLLILLAIGAIEMFMGDALNFIVIPNYIIDVLHPMKSLAHLPVIGSMLSTKVGILGMTYQAVAVASFIGSRWISGPKGAERLKRIGHKPMYRAAAIGTVLFWAMMLPIAMMPIGSSAVVGLRMFLGALGIFLGREFLTALLHTPLAIAMAPVQRNQIPNDKVGPVYQALTMIETAVTGIGSLVIGVFLDKTVISVAIPLIAAAISITAVMEWLAPNWLGKIKPEGWVEGEKAPRSPKN